jgi:pimeloyl-ACP methyl ester carboxylesterase
MQKTIPTSCGNIAVEDTETDGPALLLIHGNSCCKEIFRKQLNSDIAKTYRLVAMDLPGHGASDDAKDPDNTYHVQGYAKIALEVLKELSVETCAVYGWSLGGHAALEMMDMDKSLKGVMITGTPPVGMVDGEPVTGFIPSEHMGFTGQEVFTEEQVLLYAEATGGTNMPTEPFMVDAVRRTDGRARRIMMESFLNKGIGFGERKIVETSTIPLAIVNGDPEPFVDNNMVKSVAYANLWEDKVHLLPGKGHAPFWEAPDQFNPILERFLKDVFS